MNPIKQSRLLFSQVWRLTLASMLALLLIGGLLLYRLKTLVPALSQPELDTFHQSQSLQAIIKNPINAPYKLLELLAVHFHHATPFALRLVSGLFGALAILLFYSVLRRWHTRRVALLGSVLFATSSWFLHTARLAAPDILLITGFLALVAFGIWLLRTGYAGLLLPLGLIFVAFLLYIPGLVWFLVPSLLWWRKPLWRRLTQAPAPVYLIAAIVAAGLLLPLGFALYKQPALLSAALGFPNNFPKATGIVRNLVSIPFHLFVHAAADPVRWLDRLPLLDIVTIVMIILGLYAYYFQLRLDRTRLIIGSLAVGTILVAVGGSISLALLLPGLYIIAAAGVALMLQQWFTVFPHNPLARGLGLSLLILAVVASCAYNLDSYFIAWPHAPATKQVFIKQLKDR